MAQARTGGIDRRKSHNLCVLVMALLYAWTMMDQSHGVSRLLGAISSRPVPGMTASTHCHCHKVTECGMSCSCHGEDMGGGSQHGPGQRGSQDGLEIKTCATGPNHQIGQGADIHLGINAEEPSLRKFPGEVLPEPGSGVPGDFTSPSEKIPIPLSIS